MVSEVHGLISVQGCYKICTHDFGVLFNFLKVSVIISWWSKSQSAEVSVFVTCGWSPFYWDYVVFTLILILRSRGSLYESPCLLRKHCFGNRHVVIYTLSYAKFPFTLRIWCFLRYCRLRLSYHHDIFLYLWFCWLLFLLSCIIHLQFHHLAT